MKSELQITYRNVEPSAEIDQWIRGEVAKLDSLYNHVMGCRVAVEQPHQHRKRGSRYHVRVDVTVPGGEIVVKREPSLGARSRQLGVTRRKKEAEINVPHKQLRQAINDAFRAAGRRLQDYARRQRGDIKNPAVLPEGRISRILRKEGYGFLTADDGREIYFHKNSVLGRAFPRLAVGTAVHFVEEAGEKGPQASTVRVVSKPGMQEKAKGTAA
ncbi:MAG: cold shock domain-containing protein [Candidatus Acidiferrales bacterium]